MASIPFNVQEIMGALYGEVADIMRDDAISVVTAVVLSSPVGDPRLWKSPAPANYVPGTLVANWQVTLREVTEAVLEAQDVARAPTISKARSVIADYDSAAVQAGDSIFAQNNVPYIIPINNGHSKQVPAGFIEKGTQAALQDRGTVELP